MELSSFILENRWMLELFYVVVISSICMIIFSKTDKFFKLSLHQGLRYFRNAFLFYGFAFIFRYLFGVFSDLSFSYTEVMKFTFEFFFIMAGFFLLYSLIWKKFEFEKEYSSLFNKRILIFNIFAVILAAMDVVWGTYYFMFISQIAVFFFAVIISYSNYKRNGKKHKFLNFYFIAMLLGFAAWILNFLVESVFNWRHMVLTDIGLINIMFFMLFLYGVIKITKNDRTEVQHK